jgi:phosphohistidine phosphatase
MPDLIFSSSAKRTKKTAKGLARKMGYKKKIIFLDDLYLAGPQTLLQIVQQIRKKHQTVFIIAHNPGITDFANKMTADKTIENIPTLGVAALELPVSKWQECQYKIAKLHFFIYPKNR